MNRLKSMLATLAMLLCSISASAEDFSVDGIYYNITDSEKLTVEVTYNSYSKYTGSVVIPETVTYASKNYAVTSIDDRAFEYCIGLISVTIPDGVTSIGGYAFYYCSSLTSVTIPNSVTSIDERAFDGTAWYNNQPDGVVYAGKVAYKYKGTMPSNTSIELAEGTLGIAGGAFCFCSSLTSITIPNSVTSIGYSAFWDCISLTSVTIPDGVTSIGSSTFYNCSSLTSVTIPDGVTSIGSSAFENCSSLTSITIPNSVTSIREAAFCNCNSLTSVHISDIAAWCNIKFSYFNSNPLFYAKHLFIDGKEITELVIPDGVTSIGNYTFCKCSSLTSVTIPNSVTSIGYCTFSGCSSLTSVTIPDGVTSIGSSAFWDCISLTSVTIPDGVTSIANYAFSGCSSLTSVTIPNSVTSIGYCTFSGCSSLKSITIPDSVGYIYQESFANCKGLETVKVLAETPPFAYDNTFSNYEIELCVPEKSVEAYQKTNPWSKFKTFKNLTGDDLKVKVCATPTIAYVNGKISFASETEGVEFVSSITDSDIKNYSTADIELTVTYNISVYATKADYKNSEVAKATLCWIDVEPKSEGLTDIDIANVKALPVVVQANNGTITVTGANDGTMVEVYGISGTKLGEAMTTLNTATIHTDAQTGSVVIVKVGNKSIKIKI